MRGARRLVVTLGSPAARRRLARLAARRPGADRRVERVVGRIVADVARRGDRALFAWTARLDGVRLTRRTVRVPRADLAAAFRALPHRLRADLTLAARRIEAFHALERGRSWTRHDATGATCGLRVTPLERVGLYVPGGRAAYPSTVLMTAIPARVAGVDELVMVSPSGPHGAQPVTLAACHLAGVDALYRVGGAQAVAALAYGTETIPRVDKIVGPGNAYVAAAKRLVFGRVAIDSIAGPSEVVILADAQADAAAVAADMLAQAEHDPAAAAVCVTTSRALGIRVAAALDTQLGALPRRAIAARSLARFGAIVIAGSRLDAIGLANALAPEHLELAVAEPRRWLADVRHAGAVFFGAGAPEAFGDYLAGPNHVLPTGGTARFASPLGVWDFEKRTSVVTADRAALARLGPAVARLARAEGLEAHARAVEARLGPNGGQR